jgi:hypothetical protein
MQRATEAEAMATTAPKNPAMSKMLFFLFFILLHHPFCFLMCCYYILIDSKIFKQKKEKHILKSNEKFKIENGLIKTKKCLK